MAITRDLGIVTAYGYAVSKGYTGTEEEFAILMADYADVADIAEAWAVGTRAGVPVEEGDEAYHNNAKYYSGEAGEAAESAKGDADTAEAYAKGTVDGVPVEEGQPGYEDNAKFYAGEASDSAEAAAGSEQAAKDYADHIADPVSGLVTRWLNDHVDPSTGYVVDNTLTVQGAAADAKATGDAVADLKSALVRVSNVKMEYKAITPAWNSGYIKSSDGTPASGESYHYTDRIPLYPGQCIKVENVAGSSSVSLFAIYDVLDNFTSYANGNSSSTVRSLATENRTDGIIYVVISSNTSQATVISLSSPILVDAIKPNEISYVTTTDYVDGSGNVNRSYGFNQNLTTPMLVTKGKRLIVTSAGSASTAQVVKCTKYGTPISVLSMNTGSALTTAIEVDSDMYFMAYTNTDLGALTIRIFDNANQTDINNFNLVMPTVAFVFDDGTTGDANAVSVFKAHGKRCSFALISTITQDARVYDYLGYQDEGFEILSHSTDGRTMNGYSGSNITDESVAIQCMEDSKQALVSAGFNIHGWVTPSGRLNPHWINDTKKFYDYAFALANVAAYDGTTTPYFGRDVSAYNGIFRVSLQTTTLANCKAAIDSAIENGGMVVFYGHAVNATSEDYLTIASLDELLTYIDGLSSKIMCLPCNTAMRYFFKVTHEDFISA